MPHAQNHDEQHHRSGGVTGADFIPARDAGPTHSDVESTFAGASLPSNRSAVDGACRDPRSLEDRPSITPETLELIEENRGMYTSRVLRREIGGRERVLLVLGESHVKSAAEGEVGEEILSEFRHIGVEGAEGGAFFPQIFSRFQKCIKSCRALVGGETMQGSSIEDAYTRAERERTKVEYATELFLFAEGRGLRLADIAALPDDITIPFDDDPVRLNEIEDTLFSTEGGEIDGAEIADLARQFERAVGYRARFETIESARAEVPRIHHLEAGYRCGWREALPQVYLVSVLGAFGVNQCLKLSGAGSNDILSLMVLSGVLHLAGSAVGDLAPGRFQDTRLHLWLEGVFAGLNVGRDPVMVRNIDRMFEEDPNVIKGAVVVGKGHVGSLSRLLREGGWRQEHAVYAPTLWSRLFGSKLG